MGCVVSFQYFTQHEDAELGAAVSAGRRSEFTGFGWAPEEVPDPQDTATFKRSKLNWQEHAAAPHREMLDWYRTLIRLRRNDACLSSGNLDELTVRFDEDRQWLFYCRGRITMACNFASNAQCVPVDGAREVLLCSTDEAQISSCGVRLGPETFAVLTK
jgi:maltooligosyltrehalose trehalohydrolase